MFANVRRGGKVSSWGMVRNSASLRLRMSLNKCQHASSGICMTRKISQRSRRLDERFDVVGFQEQRSKQSAKQLPGQLASKSKLKTIKS